MFDDFSNLSTQSDLDSQGSADDENEPIRTTAAKKQRIGNPPTASAARNKTNDSDSDDGDDWWPGRTCNGSVCHSVEQSASFQIIRRVLYFPTMKRLATAAVRRHILTLSKI